ncbi:hypothetical protein NGM10_16655 (plasmid) [Halorussus salilacus]|uniref:hypothetical protein n=1 Tax=Halorussus salilacus TaxID=2953750 RepID=UPI00209E2A79|nr:hypothetical protein [Halorussus salilacus]USZ69729.1 hypothetical protein NGM10_16655 [Halorussus salilacus]
MFRAQLTDGEQIDCADYELGERGATLYGDDEEFLAFVPFANLLWLGGVTEDGRTKW